MDYDLYRAINGLTGGTFADGLGKLLANDLPVVLAPSSPWLSCSRGPPTAVSVSAVPSWPRRRPA